MTAKQKIKTQPVAANIVTNAMPTIGYEVHQVIIPSCCKSCKSFSLFFNPSFGVPVIDCKKKIFFPTKKGTCVAYR